MAYKNTQLTFVSWSAAVSAINALHSLNEPLTNKRDTLQKLAYDAEQDIEEAQLALNLLGISENMQQTLLDEYLGNSEEVEVDIDEENAGVSVNDTSARLLEYMKKRAIEGHVDSQQALDALGIPYKSEAKPLAEVDIDEILVNFVKRALSGDTFAQQWLSIAGVDWVQ